MSVTQSRVRPASVTPQVRGREQLLFLDGLRGVAALSVAVYHSYLYAESVSGASLGPLGRLFLCGQYGVTVFIVLSGFVLALPVARTTDLVLRGGSRGFLLRRARRILPPYYAALALFVFLILVIPGLDTRSGTDWDSKIPITEHAVLTHMLLIQNLGATAVQIDGPLWSVATEWQIYFLLPLLFIPLWRRFGASSVVIVGLILGVALQALVPNAHPIYIGLFAFGLLAASVVNGRGKHQELPWSRLAGGLLILGLAVHFAPSSVASRHVWLIEGLIGGGVAAGLVHLVLSSRQQRQIPLLSLLGHRRIVGFGLFSYSFYLVHSPIIGWVNLATRHVSMGTGPRFVGLLIVGLPLSTACAYGFYWLVERHFMSGHMAQADASSSPSAQTNETWPVASNRLGEQSA
jgi:peptidoglycan/LPS O-acetylase OafA/YrhL